MSELAIIKSSTLTDIADAIRTKKGVTSSGSSGTVEYEILDYIESTGAQYIDTGYKFKTDRAKIQMVVENLNSLPLTAICGSENANYSGSTSDNNGWFSFVLFNYVGDSAEAFALNLCSSHKDRYVTITKEQRHTVEIETFNDGSYEVTIDGDTTSDTYSGHMEKLYNFYIFANNNTGNASSFSEFRVCSFQIYDNNVLVRDFEPRIDAEGVIGLYDKVENIMYPSSGSDSFVAGSVIETIYGESENTQDLIPASSMASEILSISSGIELPELTNPASASHILSGKEAIDENGNIITGSIATKAASNLSASGATVYVPSGYYASDVGKSVSTAPQATPSISVNSAGLITASATQSAGYVSSGTKSATKQLTTQAAKTVTPSSSSQTAVGSGVYTTGTVTVAAVPTQTKSATPKATSQTVIPDSGKFLSSVTVSGDENLVSSNIKSGVSIFGVQGTCASSTINVLSVATLMNSRTFLRLTFSNEIVGDDIYGSVRVSNGSDNFIVMFNDATITTSSTLDMRGTVTITENGTTWGGFEVQKSGNLIYITDVSDIFDVSSFSNVEGFLISV